MESEKKNRTRDYEDETQMIEIPEQFQNNR